MGNGRTVRITACLGGGLFGRWVEGGVESELAELQHDSRVVRQLD